MYVYFRIGGLDEPHYLFDSAITYEIENSKRWKVLGGVAQGGKKQKKQRKKKKYEMQEQTALTTSNVRVAWIARTCFIAGVHR